MNQESVEFLLPATAKFLLGEDLLTGIPDKRTLDINYLNQTASNWCWATCATMLSRYIKNTKIKICEVVAILVPTGDCCIGALNDGDKSLNYNNAKCNITCGVSQVGYVHNVLGMRSAHKGGAISFDELHKQIADKGSPVEVAFSWYGGGGHVALAKGVDKQKQTVVINDPWPDTGEVIVPFSQLQSAYGRGNWFDAWSDIAVKG